MRPSWVSDTHNAQSFDVLTNDLYTSHIYAARVRGEHAALVEAARAAAAGDAVAAAARSSKDAVDAAALQAQLAAKDVQLTQLLAKQKGASESAVS